MDEMSVFIDMADRVLLNAPLKGFFRLREWLVDFGVEKYKPFVSDVNYNKLSFNQFDIIVEYMVKEDLIQFHTQDLYFLTERGKEMKGRGGIMEYEEYIHKKDNAIFESLKFSERSAIASEKAVQLTRESITVNKDTLKAIIVYCILTFGILAVSFATCLYQKNTRQTMNINSNNDTTDSKHTHTIK